MDMDIYVVDIETTGLDGAPKDYVIEIALMRVNLLKQIITEIYHTIIHYDTKEWDEETKNAWIFNQGILSLDDIQNAEKDLDTVIREVQNILSGKYVTAFNNAFDLDRFLSKKPWNINEEKTKTKPAPCLMITASDYLRPFYKKHKIYSLDHCKNELVKNDTECIRINKTLEQKVINFGAHRANYDAFYSACILLEIYRRKHYRIIPHIYYAHSMKIYGKREEKREIRKIKMFYPKVKIINPAKYEKKWKGASGKEIMKRCLDILSKSDIIIFSGIKEKEDYFIGRGVYVEIMFALELKMKSFFLTDKLEHNFTINIFDDTDWEFRFAKVTLRNQ